MKLRLLLLVLCAIAWGLTAEAKQVLSSTYKAHVLQSSSCGDEVKALAETFSRLTGAIVINSQCTSRSEDPRLADVTIYYQEAAFHHMRLEFGVGPLRDKRREPIDPRFPFFDDLLPRFASDFTHGSYPDLPACLAAAVRWSEEVKNVTGLGVLSSQCEPIVETWRSFEAPVTTTYVTGSAGIYPITHTGKRPPDQPASYRYRLLIDGYGKRKPKARFRVIQIPEKETAIQSQIAESLSKSGSLPLFVTNQYGIHHIFYWDRSDALDFVYSRSRFLHTLTSLPLYALRGGRNGDEPAYFSRAYSEKSQCESEVTAFQDLLKSLKGYALGGGCFRYKSEDTGEVFVPEVLSLLSETLDTRPELKESLKSVILGQYDRYSECDQDRARLILKWKEDSSIQLLGGACLRPHFHKSFDDRPSKFVLLGISRKLESD